MKTLGINGEFSQHVDMPHYPSPLKNNSENSRKMYYNTLRVINGEFSQQGGFAMSPHATSPFSIEK
jgi:hypothetical protein